MPFDPKKPSDSLTQVRDFGHGPEPTLRNEPSASAPRKAYQPPDELVGEDRFDVRYEAGDKLGQGGMGVVRSCVDRRIGREIAMKLARSTSGSPSYADSRARFLREARVQGQLEHPAIVPVYDLGREPGGAEYFTMKRIRGMTLEELLWRLETGDEEAERRYSRRKLLTAFLQASLAIHFAHTRGVLHRDLKPANVMLGHFGEVYVLDWGLAKLTGVDDASATIETAAAAALGDSGDTIAGELMGTPGYAPPEQLRGEFVDERSDVYALGAMLFEIVVGAALHPRGNMEETIASTKRGAETRAAVRAPDRDVPPELEEICRKATALAPADRYRSVREMCDALERFLDGDRDMTSRLALAHAHAQAAAIHADRALAGGSGAVEERRHAMREVSRAIAFDPTHEGALQIVVRLLTEPPRELPPEAQAEVEASAHRTLRVSTRAATVAYLSWAVYFPLLVWMGIREWTSAGVAAVLWAGASLTALWVFRQRRLSSAARWAVILLSTLAIASTTTIFGPFMLLPGMAAINATVLVLNYDRSFRIVTVMLACLAVIAPAALGAAGVLPSPYVFRPDGILIVPHLASFPEAPTMAFLVVSNVAIIVTACLMVARVRDSLSQAERRMHIQAWQLRQLFPHEAQLAASNPTTIRAKLIG